MNSIKDLNAILDESDKSDGDQQEEQLQATDSALDTGSELHSDSEDESSG